MRSRVVHSCLPRSYTKSVITKPQNVFILRDVMCNGYVAGGNTKFFGHDGKMLTQAMNPELVRRAIQDRLSMTDDLDADYGSMLAFLCPYTEVEVGARDQVISITERLLPWEVTKGSGSTKTDGGFPGGKVCFDLYKKAFALDQIHFGEDVRAAENMEFVANVCCGDAISLSPFSFFSNSTVPDRFFSSSSNCSFFCTRRAR